MWIESLEDSTDNGWHRRVGYYYLHNGSPGSSSSWRASRIHGRVHGGDVIVMEASEAVVATSKAVVIADHLKNNRLEYLLLVAIGTIMGWTQEAVTYVGGVCA